MKNELAKAEEKFARLETSRGYSAEEVWKLERERTALLQFIRFKYREFDRESNGPGGLRMAGAEALNNADLTSADDGAEDETELAKIAIQTVLAGATRR